LRKAKIVILDEATSNIDVMTEQRIMRLMSEELIESTVITIAHRLNTIIKSDKVLVLEDGRKIDFDTP
jgi:ABC-type multidrug transport system fused ATPase/permease subunit